MPPDFRVVDSSSSLSPSSYIDGTAEFGWGPEDPVDEGQLELRGVVFTESSGGSPLTTPLRKYVKCEYCAWLKQSQRLCMHFDMSPKRLRYLRLRMRMPENPDYQNRSPQ